MITDEASDADGLLEGSKHNLGGVSESFLASSVLADGRIDDNDRVGTSGDRGFKQSEIAVNTNGMIIDDPIRLGPRTVSIRLRTASMRGPRNRLIVGAPAIDWDVSVKIDTSGPAPTYEVVGSWDGYPAIELYINKQPVFTFTPGDRPASTGDLLKLMPGYADFGFVRRGVLRRSANEKRGIGSQVEETNRRR